ncbi:MAG: hypothetical protein MUD01_20630 [Chloroflexaceae bacterium]|nr:hypothetical protein [Chloroflexaceae bacterium]
MPTGLCGDMPNPLDVRRGLPAWPGLPAVRTGMGHRMLARRLVLIHMTEAGAL